MNEKPRKVGEIAVQLGVVPNTIRNYCKRYPDYLSISANPPSNGVRLFTTHDLNVLAFINNAVNEGLNHDEIAVQLAAKTFNSDGVDLIVGLAEVMPPETAPTAQEGQGEAMLLPAVISDMQTRLQALELDRVVQARQLSHKAVRYARLEGAAIALLAGGFVMYLWWLLMGIGS